MLEHSLPDLNRAASIRTFAGIAPSGVAAFIVAQLAGMVAAVIVAKWLWAALYDFLSLSQEPEAQIVLNGRHDH